MSEHEVEWEEIRDSYPMRYGGLFLGTAFQFAEHSPDLVEKYTGVEVPSSLFEDVFNPSNMDKGVHYAFSYSAATAMVETMDNAGFDYYWPDKFLAVNLATGVGGLAKEMTDSFIDPYDMAANFAGANTALIHHKSRLEDRYEEELGMEIETSRDFIMAEAAYFDEEYRDILDEPAGI